MRIIFLMVLLYCSTMSLLACDVCGVYLGIQPNDRSTSFGLNYRWRHLHGTIPPAISLAKHGDVDVVSTGPTKYEEQYFVLETRADVWFTQRISVMVGIPVVNNYQSLNGEAIADVSGMGDPYVLGRYVVANTKGSMGSERTVHRVTLGAGVKMPLGRTDMRYYGRDVAPDLQPGTGTWDGLLSLEYMVRRRKLGASCVVSGRFNTTNGEGHRLGHGLGGTAEVFRMIGGEDLRWAPSLGAYAEMNTLDRDAGIALRETGMKTLFTHVGSRLWWKAWALTVQYQYALLQDNGGQMVPNRQRFIIGINYTMNTNQRKTNEQ